MKKSELRKTIKEEILIELNSYSEKYQGTIITIVGMDKSLAKQIAPMLAHILKTKTEIGNLNLRSIKLEY